jgi:hypothetical protein
MSVMLKITIVRTLAILSWLTGACSVCVGYFYFQTYMFGLVDPAYGKAGTFGFGVIVTIFVVTAGLIGVFASLATYGKWQSPLMGLAGGMIFALTTGIVAAIAGAIFDSANVSSWALVVPVLLGSLSSRIGSKIQDKPRS